MRTMGLVLAFLFVFAAVPARAGTEPPAIPAPASVAEVRCPVMGGVVQDPSTAARSEYKGKTYYFCCPGCKPLFDADPEKYVGKPAK
jgi:YHS domain-containing protein